MKALRAHAANGFKTHVNGLLEAQGISQHAFAKALGATNSGYVSRIINGYDRLTETQAAKWAPLLKVTPESLVEANRQITAEMRNTKKNGKKRKVGRQRSTDVIEATLVSPARGIDAPRRTERFSFSVNPDGTANVSFNLERLPLAQALKLVNVIELPNLISPNVRLALTHDKLAKTKT